MLYEKKRLLIRYWIHVFMYSCITFLLTSCAERGLVVNPVPTDTQEISTSVTSLMKSSGSLLEGAEVKKENGKTIIKPKKKITLKEFLALQPYKFTVDSSIAKPKSAPCNYRSSYFYTLERFERMPGKKVGFFFTNTNPNRFLRGTACQYPEDAWQELLVRRNRLLRSLADG